MTLRLAPSLVYHGLIIALLSLTLIKFSKLNYCFNEFEAKHEMVNSNLSITRRNDLILESITKLEGNNLNNAQYNRRETLEINPVPSDIAADLLEQSVCQALS